MTQATLNSRSRPSAREKPLAGWGDRCYRPGGRARERGGGTRERSIDMGAPLRGHGRAIGRPGAPFRALPEGTTMQFTSEQRLDDGVLECEFTLGEIPGVLWTPASAPAPLILVGHPGGLRRMHSRLAGRGRYYAAAYGFAAAAIELPGSGDRPRSAAAEQARAELRTALEACEPVSDEIIDALLLPLLDKAVPEWQAALDALLALPEIGSPVGYSGGVISIGVRLAV